MDPKDRRLHPRLEGEFPVDLLNMGDDPSVSPFEAILPGTALDVSRQGMQLKTSYHVPVGSVVSTIFYMNGNGGSVCLCQVVWEREVEGQFLYGLFIKEWSQIGPELERKFLAMETAPLEVPGVQAPSAKSIFPSSLAA